MSGPHAAAPEDAGPLAPAPATADLLVRSAIEAGCTALARGDLTGALRWLDRAHRLAPNDPTAALLLGSALARTDPARSEAFLLAANARHPQHRGILTALASGALRCGERSLAAERLQTLLQGGAPPAGDAFATLATAIAAAVGAPGWVGLASHGTVAYQGKNVSISLDGATIKAPRGLAKAGVRRLALPSGWQHGVTITAASGVMPLLGSPIGIRDVLRVEGCVTSTGACVEGWAWHPNDPEAPVVLGLYAAGENAPRATVTAADPAAATPGADDAAPVRRFSIDAATLLAAAGPARDPLSLCGPNGTPLPGGLITAPRLDVYTPVSEQTRLSNPGLAVILPLTGSAADTAACLESLSSGMDAAPSLVLAVGAGQQRSDLRAQASAAGATCLPTAADIPAALNGGLLHILAAGAPMDVLILAAPCALPAGLTAHLRSALRRSPGAGIVQPIPGGDVSTTEPDLLYACCNKGVATAVPAVAGPCVLISAACLHAMRRLDPVLLRDGLFSDSSAALTDFSLQAASLGFHALVACDACLQKPPPSAPPAVQAALESRDRATLIRLHASAPAALTALAAAIGEARRPVAVARWGAARSRQGAIVLITHADGGGLERHVRERAAAIQASGRRAIVIRPSQDARGQAEWAVTDGTQDAPAPLRFRDPEDFEALARLLQADRPAAVELHHAASHHADICALAPRLAIPYDVYVHDFAAICPRVTLVGGSGRFCGEPADVTECDDCVADHGVRIGSPEPVTALRARSAGLFGGARRIVVPAADGARRLRRYFPALAADIVPWQDDRLLTQDVPRQPARGPGRTHADPVTVCIAGALGQDKGFEVILACARDASRRGLNLTFTVVGHTIDDARLLDTGRVFITGRYEEDEAVALIRAQRADMGFLPSVWPETWCYALSALWQAGLWTLSFALGASAERIAATGAGRSVPLGMPAARLNDFMLGLFPLAGRANLAASHG